MVRFLFSVTFAVLCCISTADAGAIKHWGIFGGLTSSNHDFDGENVMEDGQKHRIGINAGAYAEWLDVPYFSLKSQLWYAEKGSAIEFMETTYEYPLGTGLVTKGTRLSYLSCAVLGKMKMSFGLCTPYVLAGPRFDYLLDYEENLIFTALYREFEKSMYGLTFGAGVERSLPGGPILLLEARYNLDLKDSHKVDTEAFNYSIRNTSFEISGGVGF